jgi:hypothetical protein
MTLARFSYAFTLLTLMGLTVVGCGGPKAKFTEPVEGTLTWGKTPIAGVRIQFVPVTADKGDQATISSATTDENGFFSLKRDDNGKPGAVVGKHKVVVMAGRPGTGARSRDDDVKDEPSGTNLPPRFASTTLTPLEVEVKPGQTTYPLDLSTVGR